MAGDCQVGFDGAEGFDSAEEAGGREDGSVREFILASDKRGDAGRVWGGENGTLVRCADAPRG